MKDADVIILMISGVVFFVFLVILVFVIRGWAIRSFHRRCRGVGLTPSPLDRWYCLGKWQDARVAIEKCGTRRCDTLFVYMDLGELPPEALRNLNFYMQGLTADYYSLAEYRGKLEFYRIVSGSWSAPFLYSSHLRARANEFHIRRCSKRFTGSGASCAAASFKNNEKPLVKIARAGIIILSTQQTPLKIPLFRNKVAREKEVVVLFDQLVKCSKI